MDRPWQPCCRVRERKTLSALLLVVCLAKSLLGQNDGLICGRGAFGYSFCLGASGGSNQRHAEYSAAIRNDSK
jgi:hypothetical protein